MVFLVEVAQAEKSCARIEESSQLPTQDGLWISKKTYLVLVCFHT